MNPLLFFLIHLLTDLSTQRYCPQVNIMGNIMLNSSTFKKYEKIRIITIFNFYYFTEKCSNQHDNCEPVNIPC